MMIQHFKIILKKWVYLVYVAGFCTKYDKLKFDAHSLFKKMACLVATAAVGLLKEKSASHPTSLFMCKVSAPSFQHKMQNKLRNSYFIMCVAVPP